ncbi:putative nacht and ankyrin domain protein [Botrytis fragariae]|uniref:Putative nacht and ankyrin domain protein n=1 Tax=Botrytis fragariae TaxID=1964551 RepID=A0A8H6EF60_9HELO|nr:putative nacht and ankyrin domain protein [Botrytis fragariae]KAF5869941.1 putative nacht and ankyrin domain protein [Botrytis fragariae]
MNPKAVQAYVLDESGLNAKTHPQSNISTHNRVDFITHVGFLRLLTRDGLSGLYRRCSLEFSYKIQVLGIGQEWAEHTDIMKFWELPLIASMNRAIAGPLLEAINPDFTEDFLEFLPYAYQLVKSFPPWLIPRAYSIRKKLVATVKSWHSIARSQFEDHYVDADGDADPWRGSRCIRERQDYLSKVDDWDYDSMAVSDFGLLWGASINVHKAAVWAVIEIFKDPALLSRVRKELQGASFDPESLASPHFIHKLIQIPLLQSIYAEWIFPKKTPILVPCGPAHHDAKVWNTRNGEFPLDTFWADRFLLYPEDAVSGPMITTPSSNGVSQFMSSSHQKNSSKPIYCESVMRSSFIGYGVGERTCPGRILAKREIIAVFARIVQQYDIELLTEEKHFKHSMAFYRFGTQAPKNKIPLRIKRRGR